MCVILYLYPATCDPIGSWQRRAFTNILFPSQTDLLWGSRGWGRPGLTHCSLGQEYGKLEKPPLPLGQRDSKYKKIHTRRLARTGAAVAWKEGESWGGRSFHLGTNKEVFDAEVFAILQATKAFDQRNESNVGYTIFTDSQAAAARIGHDQCGPAQALAMGTISFAHQLRDRGCTLTIRWTPAHKGVPGNEHADTLAKEAAENIRHAVDRRYLEEASLSHLTRKTTETRSRAVNDWIKDHIRAERRYKPPPGGRLRKHLRRERKEVATRYFQLLSGHAAIGSFLAERAGSVPSSECWRCGSGKRQSRHHLFIECR